jgi:flagellar protein FliO/FliZ
MFGDWGGLVLQFAVTAAVILGLVGLVYWLVRRYSGAGLGRIGRGRVPRLAMVDAMPVDARRKLVLVRRDNVEHLLLVGGPSDLVVEQAIQRPRRPKPAQPASSTTEIDAVLQQPVEDVRSATAQPPPPPPSSYGRSSGAAQNGARPATSDLDKPFSFRRATPAPAASQLSPYPSRQESAPPPGRFVDLHRPTRIETSAAAELAVAEPEIEPALPDLPTADLSPSLEDQIAEHGPNGSGSRANEPATSASRPAERSPFAKPEPNGTDPGGKLADLENEMARLLGEITQKRHS